MLPPLKKNPMQKCHHSYVLINEFKLTFSLKKKSLKSIWKILKLLHMYPRSICISLGKILTQFNEMMVKKYVNWLVQLEHSLD